MSDKKTEASFSDSVPQTFDAEQQKRRRNFAHFVRLETQSYITGISL